MNIEAVRSMLLAVELGSFSAAGAQLGVPASTVSRRVSDLEADLDRRLLVRTGRGVRPADEAAPTLGQLRDVLVAIDACYRPVPALSHLRVTAPSEMAISLLPQLLPDLLQQFEDVRVEIHGTDRTVGLVEQGFDLAIRAGPLADSSYLSRPLRAAALVAVAAPSVATTLRGPDDLVRTPIVLVGRASGRVAGRWNAEPFDVEPPIVARVDSFTAALPLVRAGKAWLPTPTHLFDGSLTVIEPVRFDDMRVHALFPRRHRKQPALHAFIDLIAEALGRDIET